MSKKKRVLFICVHNSARSQMAEAYLNQLGGESFSAESAGFDPSPLNPLVIETMAEDGLDISGNRSKSVFDLYKAGQIFDYVVTVCDDGQEGQCPVFPGVTRRMHVPFVDPAGLTGSHEEKMARVREIRDAIKGTISELIEEWRSDTTKRKLA